MTALQGAAQLGDTELELPDAQEAMPWRIKGPGPSQFRLLQALWPWVGSYPVVQCIRYLMGQPIVQFLMLACGERKAMVMAPSPTRDSAVSPCFHGCPAFLHRHFPPQSPPSHPLDPSLCSQQQPSTWDCSTIPKLQLPAAAPSKEPAYLSRVCMAAAVTV